MKNIKQTIQILEDTRDFYKKALIRAKEDKEVDSIKYAQLIAVYFEFERVIDKIKGEE